MNSQQAGKLSTLNSPSADFSFTENFERQPRRQGIAFEVQRATMEPAVFSVASMFDRSSSEDEDEGEAFVIRDHDFPKMVLHIREFSFHQVNANLLWPGAVLFADWIAERYELLRGRRILELGSGTGALAIFLKKAYELDITTSDYDDVEIENNIRFNSELNDLACLPHIRHTWGDTFPQEKPYWDLIIASDILLYVKQYANLIKTLIFLFRKCQPVEPSFLGCADAATASEETTIVSALGSQCNKKIDSSHIDEIKETLQPDAGTVVTQKSSSQGTNPKLPHPCFLMSWRRRIPKDDEGKFFEGCKSAGLCVDDLGSRTYCIYLA